MGMSGLVLDANFGDELVGYLEWWMSAMWWMSSRSIIFGGLESPVGCLSGALFWIRNLVSECPLFEIPESGVAEGSLS